LGHQSVILSRRYTPMPIPTAAESAHMVNSRRAAKISGRMRDLAMFNLAIDCTSAAVKFTS
jgi:hypothetical protein